MQLGAVHGLRLEGKQGGTGAVSHPARPLTAFSAQGSAVPAEQTPSSSLLCLCRAVNPKSPFRQGALPAGELAASARDGKSVPGTHSIALQTSRYALIWSGDQPTPRGPVVPGTAPG